MLVLEIHLSNVRCRMISRLSSPPILFAVAKSHWLSVLHRRGVQRQPCDLWLRPQQFSRRTTWPQLFIFVQYVWVCGTMIKKSVVSCVCAIRLRISLAVISYSRYQYPRQACFATPEGRHDLLGHYPLPRNAMKCWPRTPALWSHVILY